MSRPTTPPQHGERRCYMRGCRRPECVAAHAASCKLYRSRRYQQGALRMDAAPFAEKVRRYADAGWSRVEIADYARVSDTTIVNLINGKLPRLNPDIARRLKALPEQPVRRGDRGHLDATGTRRRGQALFRIGHTTVDMARALDIDPETMGRILHGRVRFVTGATARKMIAFYQQKRWVPGPCPANRTRAIKRGWHGPLAWDDSTIDDPAASPAVDEPYQPLPSGRDSNRMEEIGHLLALGESEASIAKQMGSSEAYIHDLVVVLRNRQAAERRAMRKAA